MASGTSSYQRPAGRETGAIAKERYYDNTYPDFDPREPNDYIVKDKESYQINSTFKEKIREKTDIYLQTILAHKKDVAHSGSSVYTGAAGVAMTYYRAAKFHRREFLEDARSFIKMARKNCNISSSRVSFLNGTSGLLMLDYSITCDPQARLILNQRLKDMLKLVKSLPSDMPNELLYGRAGFLYSLLFMRRNGLLLECFDSSIQDVVSIIIDQGRNLAKTENCKVPLKFKWHDKNYYGAAHGTAGIMYLLLQAKEFIDDADLKNFIKPTINNLLECCFESGNLQSSEGSATDRLVQWCHGAPGAVHLFALAYEIFGDDCYLDAAIQCGEVVWRRGLLRKGCGLCHGTAGNAYTFIVLYQLFKARKDVSEEEAAKHLYRACAFAEWCFEFDEHRDTCPDRYYSLYEGLAGTAYFLMDLLQPSKAAFPGYTVDNVL